MNNECFDQLAESYREVAIRNYQLLTPNVSGAEAFYAAYRAIEERCRPRKIEIEEGWITTVDEKDTLADMWMSYIQNPHSPTLAMDISVGWFLAAVLAHKRGDLHKSIEGVCRAIEMAGVASGLLATSEIANGHKEDRDRSRRGGLSKGDKKKPATEQLKQLLTDRRPSTGWTKKLAYKSVYEDMADYVRGTGITSNIAAALHRWLSIEEVAEVGGWGDPHP